MGKSGPTNDHVRLAANQVRSIGGKTFSCRVIDYLQRKHPVWTAKHVARETGVSSATVAKWLNAGCAPSMAHVGALAAAYKLDFLAAVFVEVTDLEFAAASQRLATARAQSAALAVIVEEMQS
jgi:transcriptional regulator with XRE-family HTH domain